MTTTEQLLKRQAKTAAEDDKKAEVAYVRAEKSADEEAAKRLAEQYGSGQRKAEASHRRTRGWKCASCGYVNYDARSVCGECLSPNPAALQQSVPNIAAAAESKDPFCTIVTVAGRCYRSFPSTNPARTAAASREEVVPSYCEEDDDPGCGEETAVEQDPVTKDYVMKLPVPSRYWKFIIGTKGAALQETQRLTGATIVVPSSRQDAQAKASEVEEVLTLRAPTATALRAAELRIQATVLASKDKVEYTHFISIPLGTIPSLTKRLTAVIDEMKLTLCDEDNRITPEMFQDPARLHLTLLMLRLHTSDDLSRAISIMNGLQLELGKLFTPSDRVHLKGLNYMNDDPSEVHVVYLQIDKTAVEAKLLQLINTINGAFIAAGLALEKDVTHNEKLHATVINSKWRASSAEGAPREAFDATDVFHQFGSVDLGDHRLETVELSTLGGGHRLYGYFHSECSIAFPKT